MKDVYRDSQGAIRDGGGRSASASGAPNAAHPSSSPARLVIGVTEALVDRLMIVLILLFVGVGAIFLWRMNRVSERVMKSMALQDARLLAVALAEFRTLYASEVVTRVQERGVPVVHDYPKHEGAIPLPATMSIELGKRIGATRTGSDVRLYSDLPFPWRSEGGAHDEFERTALEELRRNPDVPFYRFESYQGRPSLRYAVADTMRSSCVYCHNSHPDSPKRDWKVGDVRGVLEIVQPLDSATNLARENLRESGVLVALGGTCSVLALGLTLGRLRKNSRLLHDRNEQLSRLTGELKSNNDVLERLSSLDPVTSLLNRRALDTLLDLEWRRAQRDQHTIALLMIDIDAFKAFNDRYGHLQGDSCLKQVAQTLASTPRRPGDCAARYGGEEFVIVLPGASLADAAHIAENIRSNIEALEIEHETSDVSSRVTVSIGVAALVPDRDVQAQDLLNRADRALYDAKRAGRNRVVQSAE